MAHARSGERKNIYQNRPPGTASRFRPDKKPGTEPTHTVQPHEKQLGLMPQERLALQAFNQQLQQPPAQQLPPQEESGQAISLAGLMHALNQQLQQQQQFAPPAQIVPPAAQEPTAWIPPEGAPGWEEGQVEINRVQAPPAQVSGAPAMSPAPNRNVPDRKMMREFIAMNKDAEAVRFELQRRIVAARESIVTLKELTTNGVSNAQAMAETLTRVDARFTEITEFATFVNTHIAAHNTRILALESNLATVLQHITAGEGSATPTIKEVPSLPSPESSEVVSESGEKKE